MQVDTFNIFIYKLSTKQQASQHNDNNDDDILGPSQINGLRSTLIHYSPFLTNCQARLLLISAKISKFHSQSLNSETKGAELTL